MHAYSFLFYTHSYLCRGDAILCTAAVDGDKIAKAVSIPLMFYNSRI